MTTPIQHIHLYIGDSWRYTFDLDLYPDGAITVSEKDIMNGKELESKMLQLPPEQIEQVAHYFTTLQAVIPELEQIVPPMVVPDSTIAFITLIFSDDHKSAYPIPIDHLPPHTARTDFPRINTLIGDLFALGRTIMGEG